VSVAEVEDDALMIKHHHPPAPRELDLEHQTEMVAWFIASCLSHDGDKGAQNKKEKTKRLTARRSKIEVKM
jgi:hypothetical protein